MGKYHLQGKRVWVAGHRGMVGSAVVRALSTSGAEILTVDRAAVDLRRQADVEAWMSSNRPQVVILAAAKVGGIAANSAYPADFLYDNLAIELAIMESAARLGVEKLTFLGSTCIYPKFAPQPIAEHALLTGPLEPTNEWYAIAKIAGLKLAQAYRQQHGLDFISLMPTNLYGPNDNFDLESSHVIPALMRKAHEAKELGAPALSVWGSGTPRREFLHVDDLANAIVLLTECYSESQHINVGTGTDVTIRGLAELICEVVGFNGRLEFDASRPDGTPLKCSDITRLKSLGWTPRISLRDGLVDTYRWFLEHASRTPKLALASRTA
jgi:GDP-L-fucose synthase